MPGANRVFVAPHINLKNWALRNTAAVESTTPRAILRVSWLWWVEHPEISYLVINWVIFCFVADLSWHDEIWQQQERKVAMKRKYCKKNKSVEGLITG